MKNTRKLFAGLTALCCIGTLLTAFPVSAESDFNPENDSFFIVAGTKGSATMLDWRYNSGYYGELLRTYPTETFSYGDVLVYDGEYLILESYPAQLGGNVSNLRKVGTYEDFFDTKNLTVTSAKFPDSDTKFGEFQFTDNAGNTYSYSQDYTNVDYGISLETAQVGDSYTFAVLDNTALLPLEKQEQPEFSAEEFFVVTKTYPESDYYMLEYFHDNGLHRTCRFQTDMNLSYGDILLADNGFTTERLENYLWVYDLSLNEDTALQNIGNCTDLMEHKKMTVKSMSYDGQPIQPSFRCFTYTLADEDGKEYHYSVEDSFGFDVSVMFSTGDVVEFAVYPGGAVIPQESLPDCVEPFVYEYAVIGTDNAENPNKYVLIDSSGDTWYTSSQNFETPLSVGDTVTIQNAMIAVTNIEGTNDLMISPQDGYQVQKTGSVLENPQTAEFTVQEIETGSPFGNRVYLEKDGTQYRIFTDWIEKNYAEYSYLDWSTVSVGDTVICVLYENYPVLGIDPDTSAEPSVNNSYNYAVIGTDNAENPNHYVLIDNRGYTAYTSSKNFETPLSVGDTITIQNAMMGVTDIEGTVDLYIQPEEGYQVQKTGSVLETPKTAEFTVQEIQTGSPFGDRVYLEKDGTQYRIFTDWIERNYAEYSYLDWESVSVGDTVTCVLYENYPVLGIEKASTETVPDLTGDADGSGKLDILDVIVINKAILGKEKLEDSQLACIDFNGNGKPDAEDTLIMMKKIVGLL